MTPVTQKDVKVEILNVLRTIKRRYKIQTLEIEVYHTTLVVIINSGSPWMGSVNSGPANACSPRQRIRNWEAPILCCLQYHLRKGACF